MNNEKTTKPFPKMIQRPEEEKAIGPIQLLTMHLLSIIDIFSGKVFLDALPLIGGEEAKEELASWKIGVQTGNDEVFSNKKQVSTYMTIALGAFSAGQSISSHITKSNADATKAIFEIASCYNRFSPELGELKKTIKSKDLSPEEKLDALWSVLDILYAGMKNKINENARAYPENLKELVADLNTTFIRLDKLTEGAKYIGLIKPENNSNI